MHVWTFIAVFLSVFIFSQNAQAGAVVGSTQTGEAGPAANSLNDGLVGYWTFNNQDIVNGLMLDKSGKGNNGNFANIATSTFYVSGKLGQAGRFDGGNDIVTMPQLPTGTGPFSISAWIKIEDLSGKSFNNGVAIISHFNNDAAGDFALSITSGYAVSFLNNRTGGNDPTGESETSANTITRNKWTHIVATWDGSVNKIYVDSLSKSFSSSAWGDWGTESNLGRLANLSSYFYRGAMDDVRVYNRALSATEVHSLYMQGQANLGATQNPRPNAETIDSGLVGYWTFNNQDMLNGKALDKSGNGNTGSLVNIATSTFYTQGRSGQAFRFDGTDDRFNMGDMTILEGASNATWSFWIKPEAPVTSERIVLAKWNSNSSETSFLITTGNGAGNKIQVYISALGTAGFTSSAVLATNKWTHVVIAFDGSQGTNAGRLVIYIDGTARAMGFAGTIPSSLTATASNMNLGGYSNGGSNLPYIKATIDELRVYNRTLSAAEAKTVYMQGQTTLAATQNPRASATTLDSGLVGYWSFNNQDMVNGAVRDKSGTGNTANLVNIATSTFYTQGKMGQGFKFDNNDDQVKVNAASSINNLSAVTYSIWVKARSTGGAAAGRLFDKNQIIFGLSGQALGLDVVFSGGTNLRRYAAASTFTLNKWTHWVVTWDGSNSASGVHIYRNGVETSYAALDRDGVGSKSSDSGSNLFIGNSSAASRCTDGILDEARIYNRVLTLPEIKQLYLQGI